MVRDSDGEPSAVIVGQAQGPSAIDLTPIERTRSVYSSDRREVHVNVVQLSEVTRVHQN